jgi:hypothetical protein
MKISNPQGVVIVAVMVDAAGRIAGTCLYKIIIGFTITTFLELLK